MSSPDFRNIAEYENDRIDELAEKLFLHYLGPGLNGIIIASARAINESKIIKPDPTTAKDGLEVYKESCKQLAEWYYR